MNEVQDKKSLYIHVIESIHGDNYKKKMKKFYRPDWQKFDNIKHM